MISPVRKYLAEGIQHTDYHRLIMMYHQDHHPTQARLDHTMDCQGIPRVNMKLLKEDLQLAEVEVEA